MKSSKFEIGDFVRAHPKSMNFLGQVFYIIETSCLPLIAVEFIDSDEIGNAGVELSSHSFAHYIPKYTGKYWFLNEDDFVLDEVGKYITLLKDLSPEYFDGTRDNLFSMLKSGNYSDASFAVSVLKNQHKL